MFSKSIPLERDQITAAQQLAIDNRFSLVELRKIHAQLLENKSVNDENQNLVIEILRVLAEMVVYGDRKSELLFDYFCEKNMLQLFLEIMWSNQGHCPVGVHVQILQTLSILISSVRNDTSLYYLLSNNHINEVITYPYDMDSDESLIAQYVSFVKTLALRLNDQTVQFFFITDTGAFPILTRSIELLKQKDPMVRIAAQTAILNVYKVNEHRARVFSLQEDVMMQLFQAIVEIMKEQLDHMYSICTSYARSYQDNDEAGLSKAEQNLGDAYVNLEDWLYYTQDLIGLNIEKFNRALVRYIVDVFVKNSLLDSCLPLRPDTTEDGFMPLKRMPSLEIETESSAARERKSIPSSVESSKPSLASDHLLASVSLTYLLQMTRIINLSYFHESVLFAILHPLDETSRLSSLERVAQVKEDEGIDISAVTLRANPYRVSFLSLLSSESPRLSLLVSYILYGLLSSFKQYCKSEMIDKLLHQEGEDYFSVNEGSREKAQKVVDEQIVIVLEVLHIIPTTTVKLCEDPEMRQMQRLDRLLVNPYLLYVGTSGAEDMLYSHLVRGLKSEHSHPLVTLQTISFVLASILEMVIQYYKNTAAGLLAILTPSPPTTPDSFSDPMPPPIPTPSDSISYDSAIVVLKEVREACRSAGQSLLSRLSSSFSEVLLVIINEEMKRFAGRIWRSAYMKMISNKILFFPVVASLVGRMGLDFDMPISPTEAMRKEVQVFLLVRALYKMFSKQITQVSSIPDDELGNYVQDTDFLCLDDGNIIPSHVCIVGSVFDMKGKKFLDSIMPIVSNTVTNTSQSPSGGYSLTASATSILTFGLVGNSNSSNRRTSFSSPSKAIKSPGSNANSPVPTSSAASPNPPTVTKLKLLFVQDPKMLVLTIQDKTAGKSVFKIHVLAPLLYTDAKVDLNDRRKVNIIVRSWRPLSNMQRLDAEPSEGNCETNGTEGNRNPTNFSSRPIENYLKAAEKSQMWQAMLVMDTEQACFLAVQHIESKRKAITAQKIDTLRSILSNWSLDGFDLRADNI